MLPTFGITPSHLKMVQENATLLAGHASMAVPMMSDMLGARHETIATVAKWLLIIAVVFLLGIDNVREWRAEILVGLLVPLIFLNLPQILWNFFRYEWGHWISLIVVLGILYTPPVNIPGPTNLWISIILLIVVAPEFVVGLRSENKIWGPLISLIIALVLFTQHLADKRHDTGPQGAFTDQKRLPTTVAIVLTIAVPIYLFIAYFNWV